MLLDRSSLIALPSVPEVAAVNVDEEDTTEETGGKSESANVGFGRIKRLHLRVTNAGNMWEKAVKALLTGLMRDRWIRS